MTLLAIDTATRSCSVGLLEDGCLLAEEHRDDGQTHSRHLMVIIDSVLSRCRRMVSDLEAVAVTVGPGSFTGLRIGMASAKGLAVSAGLPLVGVTTLEALALQASDAGGCLICPLIDARKQEVYGGFFRPGSDGLPLPEGRFFVSPPEQVTERIDEPCLYVGDGALLYRNELRDLAKANAPARFAPEPAHRIGAAAVGRLALRSLDSGRTWPAGQLNPVYVRKSDAEWKLGGQTGFR